MKQRLKPYPEWCVTIRFIFQTKTTLQISAFSHRGLGSLTCDRGRKVNSKHNSIPSSFVTLPTQMNRTGSSSSQEAVAAGSSSGLPLASCSTSLCEQGYKEGTTKPKATNDSTPLSTSFFLFLPLRCTQASTAEWPSTRTLLQPACPQLHDDLGTVDHPGLDPTSTQPCLLLVVRVLLVREQRHLASFPFRSPPGKPLGTEIEQVKWVFERLQVEGEVLY